MSSATQKSSSVGSRRKSLPRRVARWTLRLALLGTLALQLRILSDGGLRLPAFAQEYLVRRLAAEGLAFHAEAIWIDLAGRVLFIHPKIGLNDHAGPFASARAIAVRLRRRALLRGELRPAQLEFAELSLTLPALLSPTGAPQPILESGEFRLSLAPGADAWTVDQASARLLSIPAAFAGTLPALPSGDTPRPAPAVLARDFLRQGAAIYQRLAQLPLDRLRVVRVDLAPDRFALSTELPQLSLSDYRALPNTLPDVSFEQVRATLHIPLDHASVEPGQLVLHARRLHAPAPLDVEGEDVHLRLATHSRTLRPTPADEQRLALSLAAARVRKTDLDLPAVPLVADARLAVANRVLDLDISARLADAPWNARFSGSVVDRAGALAAAGELTPALLDELRRFLPEKARPVLELADPVSVALSAELAPGAKPARVVARASAGRAVAGKVPFDRAGAVLLYEPSSRLLRADELLLVQADSLAAGSYEMDTETLDFRFLLGGRLRPMAIEGWFSGWWDRFWDNFHFGPVPPSASVDIRGVWRQPRRTTVFVQAASGPMRLRELELDTLHTRLRVSDGSTDLLGFRATRGPHAADGRVLHLVEPVDDTLARLSFDVRSDFPVDALPRLFPDEGPKLVESFDLSSAPRIRLVGETYGPASATPGHQRYDLTLSTDGPLRYSGFPLDHLSLRLERRDTDLHLREIRAGFAAGLATGEATVSGPDADRWLAFDLSLVDADLALVQNRWKEFEASRSPDASPQSPEAGENPDDTPASEKEPKEIKPFGGHLSAHLVATGPLENPLGFSGSGEARIVDADLASIRLMGPISSILGEIGIKFTTLKLTEADARLVLDRNRLVFDELRLTGPSALIESKGVYTLPAGTLDFKAKIRPFDQAGGILSSTANFVTSPLSSVLEVELSGTIEEPTWIFTYGPTKLFRRLF